MSKIIDNRNSSKNLAATSRKKFLDRYKSHIKKVVDTVAARKNLKDLPPKKTNIKKRAGDLNQPTFKHDRNTGSWSKVLAGNTKYSKGDRITKPSGGGKGSNGSMQGNGEVDEFYFSLTKEEFFDLYFADMELPDFVKKNLKSSDRTIRKRVGISPVGPPPKLNMKKTIIRHLVRQIATRGKADPTLPLDPIDLRYNKYKQIPQPDREAVLFMLMDVSYSMGEFEKTIAKKFFLLLYLFLTKEHEKVDIIFIRHTEEAKEVDEDTFFRSMDSGGTVISTALQLTLDIIQNRYTPQTNVYVAQASDGDNAHDDNNAVCELMAELLPKVQYFAYIQTESKESHSWKSRSRVEDLWDVYEYAKLQDQANKLHMRRLHDAHDAYEVLHELFKKR